MIALSVGNSLRRCFPYLEGLLFFLCKCQCVLSQCVCVLALFVSGVQLLRLLCHAAAGMVPMLLVGRWGTPVPHPSPMTVVFGKPIEVPHVEDPAGEQVSDCCGLVQDKVFARRRSSWIRACVPQHHRNPLLLLAYC